MRKDTATRQAEIVAAALDIIGKEGVRGLTTARLAASLDMSEANLYRHFQDKHAILVAVTDEVGRAIMKEGESISRLSLPPEKKLEKIIESHMRVVENKSGIPRLVFSEEVHVADKELRDRLGVLVGSYIATISVVLEEGVAGGVFRQGLRVEETARTFLGMIQFAALRWSLSGFSFSLPDEGRRLWTNFRQMVAA